MFVSNHQPVGIAIKRNPDIGAPGKHLVAHLFGGESAAFAIDVEPVWSDAEREHFGTQFPEHRWGHLIGSTECAIDDDSEPVKPQAARKALLDELDITTAGV